MSQEQVPQYCQEDDEITLKELILKVKEYWREIVRNWLLIGLMALPFALFFLYKAWTTPVKYKATLTFMINEDDGGGGGLASIAGQFGFNVGSGGGEFNKDKVVALAKSGKIVYPVILDTVEIDGKLDLLGNHLIDIYRMNDVWAGSSIEGLVDFRFKRSNKSDFSIVENVALKSCFSQIVGGKKIQGLFSCSYEENTGILSISSTTISPELSKLLIEAIYTHLSEFYVLQQTEPQQKSFETLKIKADSLENLLAQKEQALANLKDSNKNVVFSKFKIREARLQREIPAYASQYAAVLQNVENADFLLKNKTPFFQIIDYPFYPLSMIKESKIKAFFIGGFIGGFLSMIFIVGRKMLRDTMSGDIN